MSKRFGGQSSRNVMWVDGASQIDIIRDNELDFESLSVTQNLKSSFMQIADVVGEELSGGKQVQLILVLSQKPAET